MTTEATPREAGALSDGLGPRAWMRPSVLDECDPVLTIYADNAQEWRDCGSKVTALYEQAVLDAHVLAERARIKGIVSRAALSQAPLDADEWESAEAAFQAAAKSMALDIILRIDGHVSSDERRDVQSPLDFGGHNLRANRT